MRGVRHPPSNPSLKLLLAIAAFLVITASAEDEWCASPLSDYGEQAQKCGSGNPERPKECCDGYTCGRANRCIPDSDDPGEDKCASKSSRYGIRAQECGGLNLDFPQECCEGHTCEEVGFRCIPKKSTDKPKPSGSCASPLSVDGNRAQECGAINPERPVKCCDGYMCGKGYRCIEDLDGGNGKPTKQPTKAKEQSKPTDKPTKQPTKAKEHSKPTDKPTEHPTKQASKPTNRPTRNPTDQPTKMTMPTKESKPPNPDLGITEPSRNFCGGYRSKSQECGSTDSGHAKRCCKGYKCHPDNIVCVPKRKKYEPLIHEGDPFVQNRPIELKRDITVVGSAFEDEDYGKQVRVPVPSQAKRGDLLLLFVGGSAGKNMPKKPRDFEVIEARGRADINLMGLYKWYDGGDAVTVGGGRNTFVTLSVVRGVDRTDPVVDSVAIKESASGKDGKAIAPSAYGVKGGVTFAAFAFDDPHVAQLQTRGFETLATKKAGDDGMAVYVSGCESTGYTEEVFVAGTYKKGGGNDVTMTVTLRPED